MEASWRGLLEASWSHQIMILVCMHLAFLARADKVPPPRSSSAMKRQAGGRPSAAAARESEIGGRAPPPQSQYRPWRRVAPPPPQSSSSSAELEPGGGPPPTAATGLCSIPGGAHPPQPGSRTCLPALILALRGAPRDSGQSEAMVIYLIVNGWQ